MRKRGEARMDMRKWENALMCERGKLYNQIVVCVKYNKYTYDRNKKRIKI